MASRKAAPVKADWRTVFRQSIARSLVIAWRLWTGEPQPYWPRQLAYSFIGILLVGLGAELWSPATNAPMPAGWGGIIAPMLGGAVAPLFAQAGEAAAAKIRFS